MKTLALVAVLLLMVCSQVSETPQTCFVSIRIENTPICDGGTFEWVFCHNPDDPGNRDFHEDIWACTSSTQYPPKGSLVFLPMVRR
jgi:hypothetical protein